MATSRIILKLQVANNPRLAIPDTAILTQKMRLRKTRTEIEVHVVMAIYNPFFTHTAIFSMSEKYCEVQYIRIYLYATQ